MIALVSDAPKRCRSEFEQEEAYAQYELTEVAGRLAKRF